jgi:hypothetical protein
LIFRVIPVTQAPVLSVYAAAMFEHVRKLVGLDAGDDFSTGYFDDALIAVETPGNGRENGWFRKVCS